MDILMVTAELAPYLSDESAGAAAPDGGAGGAVAALSRSLSELGHTVTVAAPNGTGFAEAGLLFARRLTPLTLSSGENVMLFDGQLPSGVKVTLFESESLQSRLGAYGESGKEYPDNKVRMGTLCQAAAALVAQAAESGQPFDVVHAHGWAAAAVAALTPLPTVLTVYDASQQGGLLLKELAAFGIPDDKDARQPFRLGNRANLLKGGMLSADWVTTLSSAYAAELFDDELAGAFGAAISDASVSVLGIAGGIDYAVFNPATDAALPTRFDAEAPEHKGRCRTAWLRELDLALEPERPLVVFAGPLDKSSGASLVAGAVPGLVGSGAQVVVVGAGAKSLEKPFLSAKLKALPGFRFVNSDSKVEHRRALAAADIALCPGTQRWASADVLAAQRYGAIPVAFATPAARDAIVDCTQDCATGTGFLFDEESADALVGAVGRALSASKGPGWARLRRRVMRLELGWDRAARRYEQLYRATAKRAA